MSVSSSVRRLTAVTSVAAAVVGAVALPAVAADHGHGRSYREHVIISGVQYGSPREGRYDRSLNKEWVDVTNESRRAVNLDGWTLSDEDGHTYTFRHVRLASRSTVRVHTGYGHDTRSDIYQDRRARVWDYDGDTATLRDDRGRFVDDASWGRDHGDHHGRGDRWGGDHRRDDRRHGERDHRGGDRWGGGHRDGDHRGGDRWGGDHRDGDHRGGDRWGGGHRGDDRRHGERDHRGDHRR
ncbi:lamin tail domain-containing protein [Streptomyces lucensis]|uniref:lamin tail domain-containing protein n=1 Tax=Streptomyces lucensis TaxID=67319 RepID=UPI0027E5595B|nr:lamin tail domain-containing protein [Streptomyces lucensis]